MTGPGQRTFTFSYCTAVERGGELGGRGPWPPLFIISVQDLDFAIQISLVKPLWPPCGLQRLPSPLVDVFCNTSL